MIVPGLVRPPFNSSKNYSFRITHLSQVDGVIRKIGSLFKKHGINVARAEHNRALGNARRHGKLPILVNQSFSNGRAFLTVKDNGKGFNVKNTLHKFRTGQHYWHNHGGGMKTFNKNRNVKVNWSDNGKKISLLYQNK